MGLPAFLHALVDNPDDLLPWVPYDLASKLQIISMAEQGLCLWRKYYICDVSSHRQKTELSVGRQRLDGLKQDCNVSIANALELL